MATIKGLNKKYDRINRLFDEVYNDLYFRKDILFDFQSYISQIESSLSRLEKSYQKQRMIEEKLSADYETQNKMIDYIQLRLFQIKLGKMFEYFLSINGILLIGFFGLTLGSLCSIFLRGRE